MANNYQFATVPDSNETAESHQVAPTDWRKCVLCQGDTDEHLVHPGGMKNILSGYETLAHNILELHNI